MNTKSSLANELQDKAYREAYVASQIRIGLPFQIRSIRQSRGLTQQDFAKLAEMSQPRISEIETPGARSLTLDTLLKIANALDVALNVRFLPFSGLVEWVEDVGTKPLAVTPFALDMESQADRNAESVSGRPLQYANASATNSAGARVWNTRAISDRRERTETVPTEEQYQDSLYMQMRNGETNEAERYFAS